MTAPPRPSRSDEHDLIRALARDLAGVVDVARAIPDERAARVRFARVAHAGRCPGCAARRARVVDDRLSCRACGRAERPTVGTPLTGTRISLRRWFVAIWYVHVAVETTSARGFARREGLRIATAWALLHRVRDALPNLRPDERATTTLLLGRAARSNRAVVGVAFAGGEPAACVVEECPPARDRPRPQLALWLGHLRAWIVHVFRGVSARHVDRYLMEHAARVGRAGRLVTTMTGAS